MGRERHHSNKITMGVNCSGSKAKLFKWNQTIIPPSPNQRGMEETAQRKSASYIWFWTDWTCTATVLDSYVWLIRFNNIYSSREVSSSYPDRPLECGIHEILLTSLKKPSSLRPTTKDVLRLLYASMPNSEQHLKSRIYLRTFSAVGVGLRPCIVHSSVIKWPRTALLVLLFITQYLSPDEFMREKIVKIVNLFRSHLSVTHGQVIGSFTFLMFAKWPRAPWMGYYCYPPSQTATRFTSLTSEPAVAYPC